MAWLIDIVLIGAILRLLDLPSFPIIPEIPFLTFGTKDLLQFLYWTVLEGYQGQSVGKMLMRLRVTDLDGSPPTLTAAAIGSFGKTFLLPIDCLIGWLAETCQERKQRLFNMLSKTVVIAAPREAGPPSVEYVK